jgi:hypothetical protein
MGFYTMTDIVSWTMNADVAVQTTPDAFIKAIPRNIVERVRKSRRLKFTVLSIHR